MLCSIELKLKLHGNESSLFYVSLLTGIELIDRVATM